MRTKKYKIYLNEEERAELMGITSKGQQGAKIIRRANILLALDENQGEVATQKEIAGRYNVSITLVHTVSKQYVEEGLRATITRKERATPSRSIVTGEIEAKIIQIACSEPPEGKGRWTLEMMENEMGRQGIKISDNTIHRVLKKPH